MKNSKIKQYLIQVKTIDSLFGKNHANIKILGNIIKPVINEKNWNTYNGILANKE